MNWVHKILLSVLVVALSITVQLFIGTLRDKQTTSLNKPSEKLSQKPQECPDPEDILPCVCKVNREKTLNLDCSEVKSEEELRGIFRKPFPTYEFSILNIWYNENLRSLKEGDFGQATFGAFSITYTNITTVEPRAFIGSADTAEMISVGFNKLESFPFDELESYPNLNDLTISGNNFAEIPKLHSSTVSRLVIAANAFTSYPVDTFVGLKNLRQFYGVQSSLAEILPGTFSESENLQEIYLFKNALTSVPSNAIVLHGGNTVCHLGENKISSVEVGAIKGVTGRLHINKNELTTLDEAVWRPILESAKKFFAGGNPLRCDCGIAWIILNPDFMAKLNGDESCADGRKLKELDPQDLKEKCQNLKN